MNTLFLDLASHSGILACVTDDRVTAMTTVDHRIGDAALVPYVEDVLAKAGWTYPDLTHLACVVGPGGFTSLRVAVALGNALSGQLGIPVAGIHLSDLYCARLAATISKLSLPWWLHSTKKNELFIRALNEDAETSCITIGDLPGRLQVGQQWMGELISEHRKIVDDAGLSEAPLQPLEDILPSFLKTLAFDHRTLEPWYGRGW